VPRRRARRVVVSDCPVRKGSRGAFERSGVLAAASAAGAEIVTPEDSRYVAVPSRSASAAGTSSSRSSSPTRSSTCRSPSTTRSPGSPAGSKNWFGITGVRRIVLHEDVQRSIAEFAALMRPTLTIVDATRVLMSGAPEGGNVNDVKAVRPSPPAPIRSHWTRGPTGSSAPVRGPTT